MADRATPILTPGALAGLTIGAAAMAALTFLCTQHVPAAFDRLAAAMELPRWAYAAAWCSSAVPPMAGIGLASLLIESRWRGFASALMAGAAVIAVPLIVLLAAMPRP